MDSLFSSEMHLAKLYDVTDIMMPLLFTAFLKNATF